MEHEVTVQMQRSLEERCGPRGTGDHDAVDRYTFSVLALSDGDSGTLAALLHRRGGDLDRRRRFPA